jgi:hypothetical protein
MKKTFIVFTLIIFVLDILFSLPCHGNLVCTGPASGYLDYAALWILVLIPLSIFALVLNNQKHKFWLKFSGIFFAIAMFIVFLMPEYDSSIVSVDRELTNWFFLGVYALISIIYFIVQFIKKR